MATLRRSLTVSTPLERVAGYLSDLTTTTQWDPHTVRCRRLDDGPVAVGARYEHTRAFGGYEATIEMQVVDFESLTRIAWRGGNDYATGQEEIRFALDPDGDTTVTHSVEITLLGVARFGNAMLPSVLNRIADDGTDALGAALRGLADHPEGR